MEDTCISSGFELTDLCFGCGHVDRISKAKKTDAEKNAFLNKPRARKNMCSQPWHQKYKDASKRKSILRDDLIKKYKILSDGEVNKLNVFVNNFNRKKVTSGKKTYELNRLTVTN